MKKIMFISLLLSIITLSCTSQNIGFTKTLVNPKLEKLWETDAKLFDLESAIFDKNNNVIYVTNINGHWLKPNGKGFISKVDLNGKIINHKWIDAIDGPTGTALCKNKLFVADFNKVLEIDIKKGIILQKHIIDGTERINDLTMTKDGTIYGTGTKSGKLFALKNGKINSIKNDLNWPNGVLVENENILIGLGDKSIKKYNLQTNKTSILTKGISNPDGIVAIGNGDYLVSSWEGLIHYVKKNGDKKIILNTSKQGINAADITYIPSKKMLLVPAMLKHTLIAYTLKDEN